MEGSLRVDFLNGVQRSLVFANRGKFQVPLWRGDWILLRHLGEMWRFDATNVQGGGTLGGGGGGTTRPLPRDGGAEELRGDPTIGPHPKVWTIDRE